MTHENEEDTYEYLLSRLKIDRDALDIEVLSQPNDFFHASEGYVKAVARRDRAKHELEVCVAGLDKDVRDEMITNGDKITENLVKMQLTREQDYHKAQKKYLQTSYEADRWESLRNAYRQRADMLRSLVQLYQAGYFGEVTGASERRDARKRFDEGRRTQ